MSISSQEIFEHYTIRDIVNLNTLLGPFVISKKHKTIYFHIAKTGGSSIVKLLRNNGYDDMILSDRRVNEKDKFLYFKEITKEWDSYFKFTFTRNKFDQLISLFHYDKNGGLLRDINKNTSGLKDASFEDFIKYYVSPSKNELYDYWIDQYYLTQINNKSAFDFIGKFNQYDKDLNFVCDKLGIKNTNIRENIGNYNKKKLKNDYYNEELIRIVKSKFKKEFEYFKWDY